MTADVSDKVAIVTGGSRGIGLAIAHELAAGGARVVLSSRKIEDLEEAASEINARRPGSAVAIAAHTGRQEDLDQLVRETLGRFGRIDILVNNAATNPHFGATLAADRGVWEKTIGVNLLGPIFLIRAVVEGWMSGHGGAIVNVASVGGLEPMPGLGVYNVTKAAVIHLTRQLAMELGPNGIRVNAVAPGVIRTRFAEALWQNEEISRQVVAFNPLHRIGQPEEVAGAVAFLASDSASYINGEVVTIDGGGSRFFAIGSGGQAG